MIGDPQVDSDLMDDGIELRNEGSGFRDNRNRIRKFRTTSHLS